MFECMCKKIGVQRVWSEPQRVSRNRSVEGLVIAIFAGDHGDKITLEAMPVIGACV